MTRDRLTLSTFQEDIVASDTFNVSRHIKYISLFRYLEKCFRYHNFIDIVRQPRTIIKYVVQLVNIQMVKTKIIIYGKHNINIRLQQNDTPSMS